MLTRPPGVVSWWFSVLGWMGIATSLQRRQPIDPQGLSGALSIDPEGRVRRELEWVRIKGGVPEPIDAGGAPIATPTN